MAGRTTSRKTTAASKPAATDQNTEKLAAADSQQETETIETAKKMIPTEVDIHQYIPVHNGFEGTLVYKSRKTGELFVWEGFDEVQDIELQELKSAKSADKAFFRNNWFMFDEEFSWVIDYLGMRAFYRNALPLDQFDELFSKKPEEIKKIIAGLSEGQKASIGYRARQLIAENGIDSNKAIAALEDALGIQLVER